MDDKSKEIIKENFERGTLSKLEGYLKGKKYRVNLLRHGLARDIKSICSIRDFVHKEDGVIVNETVDLDFEVISDNMVPGSIKRYTEGKNSNVMITKSEEVFPFTPSGVPLLIAKKVRRTDLLSGFFNKEFIDVYIIV